MLGIRRDSKRSLLRRTTVEGELHVHPAHVPRWRLNRAKVLRLLAGIAVGIGLIVWGLLAEFPTGPKSGTTFTGNISPRPFTGKSLRVGTFNIHGGFGRDQKYDLARTSAALHGLELIGLNEVQRRPFSKFNQAQLLAEQLHANWLFAPTEFCWRGEHFGSAVLSPLQVDAWQRMPLECPNTRAGRNLVLLKIPLPKGNLNVIVTHADRTNDRAHHLQTIFSLFNSLEEPALLMGDLNTHRADPLITGYIDSGEWTDCIGEKFPDDPFNRIDWILARGIKPVAAGLINNGASDHPCGWAELDLSPYTESAE